MKSGATIVTPINAAVSGAGERSTLSREVYSRLRQSIFELRMPPGQRYSEHELAAALQVSRTPLRLALHVLAHEGYVQNVGGHSSWQVRPLDLAFYEDLYDYRVEIEVLALRRLCAANSAPQLEELRAFWCVPEERREFQGSIVAQHDEVFHSTLVRSAGNQAMLRSFDELTDRIRIIRRLDFISRERILSAYAEHGEILRAVDARDGVEAERLIRSHIEASRVEIRGITFHRMAVATSAAASAGVAEIPPTTKSGVCP
jgi:DNA-binding GntR family transcriptional regulator